MGAQVCRGRSQGRIAMEMDRAEESSGRLLHAAAMNNGRSVVTIRWSVSSILGRVRGGGE